MVHSKFDYCNCLYYSLLKSLTNRLQLQQIQKFFFRVLLLSSLIFSYYTSDLCTGSRLTNALNVNSFLSPINFLQPAKLSLHNLISVQSTCRTCSSSAVILAPPSVSLSLQITNCCFCYASPYLWNKLPPSFRQPHSVQSLPSWFTSSSTHHLVVVPVFPVTIYFSLSLSLQT